MSVKKGVAPAHEIDPHFLRRVDDEELHELLENTCSGCPLCITSDPWSEGIPGETVRRDCLEIEDPRRYDEIIGEGLVAADLSDHRYFDEKTPESDRPVFLVQAGEIVVQGCSTQWVKRLQKIGFVAINSMGHELYDLFFPFEKQDLLADELA
ncbi:MAG: hypothetical protein RLZZ67_673 [Candidatus Parcubacteria bacterium]|jgi:hypothetical protein